MFVRDGAIKQAALEVEHRGTVNLHRHDVTEQLE
jgi:hypothetical protein